METEIREIGLYHVLIVFEKIDLYNVSEFKKIFFDMTNGQYTHVAVELRGNSRDMSSSVIGALISGQKKMTASKGKLVILSPTEHILNLFHMAGLKDFFTIVDDSKQLIF
ncbi:MAG: STAS domain-containing protein [Spirochaetota bacterium]